ncbi:Uncharacterized protein ABJ99_2318 [Pseudomonas syringae pv. cilantro]|uniref:DUF4124 domain-containing protein n=3 Tax=Pseudomonas TaxID=286 RepID=A0A0N0X9D9_PSESX|nr:Uncharacterized protein ABJ99_2318 [Pseudomonas syringae pv. cilantro]KPW77791.1 Uncharacterized protein ALO76_00172 [Pseudomonas syringae pv. coriandricola]RMN06096.1 hypothetical protein ALQ65_02655 [Pseudomonas syringae pv. coriandricola]
MNMRGLLICLLLLATLPAVADVYTYIDAQGNRVFTDQPRKNAKRVDIPPSNNMTGTPPTRTLKAGPARPAPPTPMFHYQLLRILVPEPDATLNNPSGDFIVTVTSEPALQPGHSYRLLLDGVAVGQPGRSPVFPVSNIDRGTHQLSVEVFDELGRVLEKTPNQPLHVQRVSLAQKRMTRPCTDDQYGVRPECPLKDKPEPKSSILPFF